MNQKTLRYIIFSVLFIICAVGIIYFSVGKAADEDVADETGVVEPPKPVEQPKLSLTVEDGEVWSKVCERGGLEAKVCYSIYDSTKDVYDLAKIRVGKVFDFYADASDSIYKIIYAVDSYQKLYLLKDAGTGEWSAKLEEIQYEVREKTIEGTVDSSLYEDALAAGAADAAIMQFAENLEYTIDFAYDPRVGDRFKFIYEENYLDGKFVVPGKVLAGVYDNAGTQYQIFYFEESEKNKGYFEENGNAVQKMFLRAPVAFKYISSPFTTGKRYIEAFNASTNHRAVDYAADPGTPIRAVGDGTVTYSGWNGGYGKLVEIRHSNSYTTRYGHQSRIAVKKGQHVTQGQVIGYVGSTGYSTGPHLHYEMIKDGVKVNPSREVMPPGKPISAEKKEAFMNAIAQLKEKIKIQ